MNKEHRLTNEEVNSKTSEIIIPCSIFKTYSKFVLFLVFLPAGKQVCAFVAINILPLNYKVTNPEGFQDTKPFNNHNTYFLISISFL